MSALAFPDAQVYLLFLPGVPLPITAGVGGMVCLDVLGIIRGWRCVNEYNGIKSTLILNSKDV